MGLRREVVCGDCLAVLPGLAADSVDAVVTDPPYGLRIGGAAWDSDVAFSAGVWREVFRVLRPGGVVMAFGAVRTAWRIAAAITEAGGEVFDGIAWVYSTGCSFSAHYLMPAWEPVIVARAVGAAGVGLRVGAVPMPYAAGERRRRVDAGVGTGAGRFEGRGHFRRPVGAAPARAVEGRRLRYSRTKGKWSVK